VRRFDCCFEAMYFVCYPYFNVMPIR